MDFTEYTITQDQQQLSKKICNNYCVKFFIETSFGPHRYLIYKCQLFFFHYFLVITIDITFYFILLYTDYSQTDNNNHDIYLFIYFLIISFKKISFSAYIFKKKFKKIDLPMNFSFFSIFKI